MYSDKFHPDPETVRFSVHFTDILYIHGDLFFSAFIIRYVEKTSVMVILQKELWYLSVGLLLSKSLLQRL